MGKTILINNALKDVYVPLSEKQKAVLRKKNYIEENTKIIVFAGRLDDVKGLAFLIRAFKKVLNGYPDIRLFIAGEGNFNAWMKEADGCYSKISFTGRLDKKNLFELYGIADIGVVCSVY
ncbi:hypothetical protein FACS1894123_10170 [Bacteroidia bacterium]|nr:hypothetical protein FACS1894123_10170 [Bacteroidia bacterium]